jgi:hypothetical protein
MKQNLIFTAFFILLSMSTTYAQTLIDGITVCHSLEASAKCTGSMNCRACKNCSGCKHCNSGGTCGVCAKAKVENTYQRKSTSTNYSTTTTTTSSSSSLSNNFANTNNETKVSDFDAESILIVIVPQLNLRDGSSTGHSVLEKLKQYQQLFFLEEDGEWVKVRVRSTNTIGYVHKKYIALSN